MILNTIFKSGYSKSSQVLLLNTLLVALGAFILNPYLLIGAKESLGLDYTYLSTSIMISMIIGSSVSLLLATININDNSRKILLSAMLFSTLGVMIIYYSTTSKMLIFYTLGLIFIRICMASATIMTRSIHTITNIHHEDCSPLFSSAAMMFGIGSSVGPILGAIIFQDGKFGSVIIATSLIYLLGFIIILINNEKIKNDINTYLTEVKNQSKEDKKKAGEGLIKSTPFYVICIIFNIFLGQSISVIPIKFNETGGGTYVSFFFFINAILLIIFSIPVAILIKKLELSIKKCFTISLVSMLVAILLIPSTPYGFYIPVLITIFYSIGEIIFPVYAMEYIRKYTQPSQIQKNISIYSFLSNAIGIGFGQYFGVYIYQYIDSHIWHIVWLSVTIISILLLTTITHQSYSVNTEVE
ncbi:MFS transporter [Dickeya chrysanthemi]|uniref:MFS transporter n=1 Tax=Dickeya chrysanthemi TaxID=556 RepID=A0ABU8JNW2_DICCH|nr:MFS transporter [Dickeya chrysanthemi]MBX9447221.1 MFS transporter [Dickeya chrysanthemi]